MEEQLKILMRKKDQIEKQIQGLTLQIQSLNKEKSLESNLVDRQGFPRADLDFGELSNYRNLKRRRNELNNQHLPLMKQIQTKLFSLHASFPQIQTSQTQVFSPQSKAQTTLPVAVPQQLQANAKIEYLTPFARVSLVEGGSPAQEAGVAAEDLLSEFEDINIYTMDNIKQIPRCVAEGKTIRMVLMRRVHAATDGPGVYRMKDGNHYQKIQLQILLKKWAGRGLLGCKIDPF